MPAPVTVDLHCGSRGSGLLGGLVDEHEDAVIGWPGSVRSVEGLLDEVLQERGEGEAEAVVAEGRAEVEGVASTEKPVERDLAAVGGCGDLGVGPWPHGVSRCRVDLGGRTGVGLPLALEPALHLAGGEGGLLIVVVGE